jgi:predicted Fe-S protein YdhL (DUF1289 family)
MTDPDDAFIPAVPTPCVRNCCLDEHDVCLGCHRSIAEIMAWQQASRTEKMRILSRSALRRKQRHEKTNGRAEAPARNRETR